MPRLPDLVLDSKLDTEIDKDYTIHTYYESKVDSLERAAPRIEYWKQGKYLGKGSFGSVWLQECTENRQGAGVRAVKKIVIGKPATEDKYCVRELEAIAKFSHQRVYSTRSYLYPSWRC